MKTTKIICFAMIAVIVLLSSCNDDEKPQTAPTVTTGETIITTTTTATVSGAVIDDGNTAITEAGFVYSSNVAEPTTADNKTTVTVSDEFETELTGLSSGTVYKVRAYAINKIGTAYGETRSFETGNLAPEVTNVTVTGTLEVAKTLTASYTYTDAEGNAEDQTATGTAFQWYVADDGTGTGEAAIEGATSKTFEVADAQNGKFLRVAVTPKANAGTLTGTEVKSSYTTAIGAETVTFTYNGASVIYGTILSATTGKKWLDRSLGATRAAQTATDYQAYGDLFQWGRLADGHQIVTRTSADPANATLTETTTETSPTDVPPNSKYILNPATTGDWLTTPNINLWQGVSGTNNPCPAGWRIPTLDEWIAEGITNGPDGFAKLKLTYGAGTRSRSDGSILSIEFGYYWSSTRDEVPDGLGRLRANYAAVGETLIDATAATKDRKAAGKECRCVKD